MKIPKQFVLKGKQWKVAYRKQIGKDAENAPLGLCEFDKRRILIQQSLTKEERQSTFLHELVHATLYEAHLSPATGIEPQAEEIVCDAIADMIETCFKFTWKRVKT